MQKESTGYAQQAAASTSGLPNYPVQGDTFRTWFRTGGANEGLIEIYYGTQSVDY